MIRSANEIAGLVAKAARGAGLPLGLAEDLATAIPEHVSGPVEAALAALSRHLADPRALSAHVAALDRAEVTGIPLPVQGCPCLDALSAARSTGATAAARACDVTDEGWRALEAFAARTLVPASDASRRAGAGAGLTDND